MKPRVWPNFESLERPALRSLNHSTCVGVVLYEVLRQRADQPACTVGGRL